MDLHRIYGSSVRISNPNICVCRLLTRWALSIRGLVPEQREGASFMFIFCLSGVCICLRQRKAALSSSTKNNFSDAHPVAGKCSLRPISLYLSRKRKALNAQAENLVLAQTHYGWDIDRRFKVSLKRNELYICMLHDLSVLGEFVWLTFWKSRSIQYWGFAMRNSWFIHCCEANGCAVTQKKRQEEMVMISQTKWSSFPIRFPNAYL